MIIDSSPSIMSTVFMQFTHGRLIMYPSYYCTCRMYWTEIPSLCSRLRYSYLLLSLLGIVTEATDTLDGLRKERTNVGEKNIVSIVRASP